MTRAITAIWTTPSMTNSTALKAGSNHSIRLSENRTGLTKVSNSQVCVPTQRSISGRTLIVRGGAHRRRHRGRLEDEDAVRRLADRDAAGDFHRREVDDGNAAQEALRHPQLLAVGRDVH